MAYIANKPVRFDRNYAIGEIIPDSVVDPKMAKRLAGLGKITSAGELPSYKAHLSSEQFNGWTVEQLIRFAADLGVEVSGDVKQEDLIALITAIDFELGEIEKLDFALYAPEGQETPSDVPSKINEFVCDVCGKVCISKATLTNRHTRKRHKFSCCVFTALVIY